VEESTSAPVHERTRALSRVSTAGARTLGLSLLLVALSAGALVGLGFGSWHPPAGRQLRWHDLMLIAALAELLAFHLTYRREDYTFSLSEVTLVLGLLYVSPWQFALGRLCGEALVLVLKERQPARKLLLNLATKLTEVVVVVGVFRLLDQVLDLQGDITRPSLWGAVLLAVLTADLVSFVVVLRVMRWHGAPMQVGTLATAIGLTACVNAGLGLVASIVVSVQPLGLLLLSGLAGFLFLSYRAYEALDERYSSLELLNEFTRLVGASRTVDEVLDGILTQARDQLRAERAEIWLADTDGFIGRRVDESGRSTVELPHHAEATVTVAVGGGQSSRRVTEKRLTLGDETILRALRARDALLAPISENGKVVGMIAVINRLGEISEFDDDDEEIFARLATHAASALENGRLIDRLHDEATRRQHEAQHDALTGLPNRTLFTARLDQRLDEIADHGGTAAVAILDLDGFKTINDTLGHQWGDEVLIEVARRLTRIVDSSVTVARLGGDEFAVIFPTADRPVDIERAAEKLRATVATPLSINELTLNVGVSIGLAVAPIHGIERTELIERADLAMYEAKTAAKAGHGPGVALASADVAAGHERKLLHIAGELPEALADDDIELLFLPRLRLGDDTFEGFEALARWTHPDLGHLPPREFIAAVSATSIGSLLTERVVDLALAEAARWQSSRPGWTVSINVTVRDLTEGQLLPMLDAALRRHALPATLVTVELPASEATAAGPALAEAVRELVALGVRVSLDDFGSAELHLAELAALAVHEVKLDKELVAACGSDPTAARAVTALRDIARSLGLEVVAEGIEGPLALETVRSFGLDAAQGFHLCAPLAAAELGSWLDTNQPHLGNTSVGMPSWRKHVR
jgi:diguanylate cyclase (GGDEF)-like protein